MRALGIDYGAARVGVALGDTGSGIATPWAVIPNDGMETLVSRITDMIEQEDAERVVVGIPKPLQQASLENDQVREIRGFIQTLREAGISVEEWDESFSSSLAAFAERSGRGLTAAGRPKEKGEKRDDLAAAVMLEGWLQHAVSS